MIKKLTALAALAFLLLAQRPLAQGAGLRIYFVDIGQGAGTLIVGPPDGTGKVTSLLVDGGPPGGGTTKIIPLLDALGIAKIDYTVVTHYHIDHISGITELLTAGRVGAVAYDNGDVSRTDATQSQAARATPTWPTSQPRRPRAFRASRFSRARR